jgi:hypothetical protein
MALKAFQVVPVTMDEVTIWALDDDGRLWRTQVQGTALRSVWHAVETPPEAPTPFAGQPRGAGAR